MTSYIQLINKIDAFCSAHYQIKRFDAEFGEQRPNLATESEVYPYVFMSPTSGTPNYDLNQITVDITCYDIIQKDRANLNTIVSDCHLILTDLFGYYNQGKDDDIIALSASQTPLNNYDLDYVAGWSMTITFELEGWCTDAIPMSPIPSGGGACEDASYTVEYADGTLIESGTIPSGGSKTVTVPNCPTCDDATWTLKDTDGNVLNTGTIVSGGSADITAPDATVENSDASYTDSVLSGGSLVLPDQTIIVTDENDNVLQTITDPVYTNVNIDLASFCPTCDPSPVGATLMKTGQTTSYRTGDDGDLEAGRATDFFTLANANPFGSTSRFTDELGGSTYANDILIDWSTYDNVAGTVLGWRRTQNGVDINWNNAIDGALAVSIGTFTTGWRLPNAHEMQSLFCWNIAALNNNASQFSYAPFWATLGSTATFWTSTTLPAATTQAMRTNAAHRMDYIAKTTVAPMRYIPCRTFTVTGTTLT